MRATIIDSEPVQALQDVVREIRDRATELDQQLEELLAHLRTRSLGAAGGLAENLVDDAMRWSEALDAGARMLDEISASSSATSLLRCACWRAASSGLWQTT